MSKRSYYYRRSRRTYPKQKWQTSVVDCNVEFNNANFSPNHFFAKHSVICQTPIPVTAAAGGVVSANNIIKTGNFKVKGTIYEVNNGWGKYFDVIIYVIFVPQGITPNNEDVALSSLGTSLFYSHPEWVLGWTKLDLDAVGSNSFSISSRLKRNLNSGDSIQLGVLVSYRGTSTGDILATAFKATVQYAARAN